MTEGNHAHDGAGDAGRSPDSVRSRAGRYLVAPTGWVTAADAAADPMAREQKLIEALRRNPDLRVLRVVRSSVSEAVATEGHAGSAGLRYPTVALVETTPEQATILAARPEFHVDIDQPLKQRESLPPWPATDASSFDEFTQVRFQARNEEGEQVQDAFVYVHGGAYPVTGRTDAEGFAELTVPAGTLDDVEGVYVRPRADHWSVVVDRPALSHTEINTVVCRRLGEVSEEHPGEDWARQVMGFDRLPPTYRGHGVKIAVVGSGVAAGRLASEQVTGGIDVVGQDDKSWDQDLTGRATHHVALIVGHDGDRLVGVAPEAEVHVCRAFPGGRLSNLIEVLDYCITQEVDIIDLGVYAEQPSVLVAQKLEEVRQAGILCVAAAGDTAGPVAFPGTLPALLTVAAIGRLGTFPPDSAHAAQVAGIPTPEGLFAARSSCCGPEVDAWLPGVAVISVAATGGRVALDGSAVAATYGAALAGLVLAHHPDFRYSFVSRGPARVQRLAQLVRASRRPLAGLPGAGVPDATVAVGLAPPFVSPGEPWAGDPIQVPQYAMPADRLRTGYAEPSPGEQTATLSAALRAAELLVPELDD